MKRRGPCKIALLPPFILNISVAKSGFSCGDDSLWRRPFTSGGPPAIFAVFWRFVYCFPFRVALASRVLAKPSRVRQLFGEDCFGETPKPIRGTRALPRFGIKERRFATAEPKRWRFVNRRSLRLQRSRPVSASDGLAGRGWNFSSGLTRFPGNGRTRS